MKTSRTEDVDDLCRILLNAKPINDVNHNKIKWPKRKKWHLPKGKVECKKVTYHPGTREARQLLEQAGRNFLFCESCGIQASTSIHHIDGNPFNNSLENLRIICQMCHARTHGIDEAEAIDEYEGVPVVDE